MIRQHTLMALMTMTVLVAGCSTVKLKPGADDVLVLEAARVKDCTRLGKTRVSVADKFGVIPRGDKKVAEDLKRLARNSAVNMGGDTISVESGIEKGEQAFGVYNCVDE